MLAAVVVLVGATVAGADTRQFAGVALDCVDRGTGVGLSGALTVAAPDEVPENGAALVRISSSLPPATRPNLQVTGVQVTVGIPQADADVDLTFAGGTIPARTWDARGGERVVITFLAPTPVPYDQARLAEITVINTFDPGTSGQAVAWTVYRSLSISVLDSGGPGTIGCTTATPSAVVGSTRITAPTAPHDRAILARDAEIRVGAPVGETPVDHVLAPATAAPPAGGVVATGTASATNAAIDGPAGSPMAAPDGAPTPAPAPVSQQGLGDVPPPIVASNEVAETPTVGEGAGGLGPWLAGGAASAAIAALFGGFVYRHRRRPARQGLPAGPRVAPPSKLT